MNKNVETYAVYVATDSYSAPIAVAGSWSAANDLAHTLNTVMDDETDLFYVDNVLSRGELPTVGYYRDADNITLIREIDTAPVGE